jgi:hypothetical protein
MKNVARFITRFQGEGDGLFIGTLMKGAEGVFKPNTVYEIQEVFGELTISEVGQGIGAGPDNCVSNAMSEGKNPFHWATPIGTVIEEHGSFIFLTHKEYSAYVEEQRKTYANMENLR